MFDICCGCVHVHLHDIVKLGSCKLSRILHKEPSMTVLHSVVADQ